jgi:hypothetical protein
MQWQRFGSAAAQVRFRTAPGPYFSRRAGRGHRRQELLGVEIGEFQPPQHVEVCLPFPSVMPSRSSSPWAPGRQLLLWARRPFPCLWARRME